MWTIVRTTCFTASLITTLLLSLGSVASGATPGAATPPAMATIPDSGNPVSGETAELAWAELAPVGQCPPVRIWLAGQKMDAGVDCYVITHGMGGTSPGDRFHQLAAASLNQLPQVRVLRIDWNGRASATISIIPNPWKVAAGIDELGDQAARVLESEGIDPARTTFIGESFGNWMNARIAHRLGGVQGLLALNPAIEGAGYTPPNLRKHAQRSWSFHTYSVFDTTCEIAESDFWLETPADSTHWGQHVSGISWLSARIRAGDLTWLRMDKPLPKPREGHFQSLATMDGALLDQQPPRERPVPVENSDHPSAPLVPDISVATR